MNPTARKGKLFIIMLILLATTYRLVGELTLKRSQQLSMLTPLDEAFPFIPEMTLIYMSVYFMWLPLVFASQIDYQYFWQIVKTTYLSFCIFYLFYLIVPSAYPRPPIFDCSCWRHTPLNFLYALDLPNNTFPSSHAGGVAVLLTTTFGKFRFWPSLIFKLWGLSVIVSTVAIKQHYIFDTIIGSLIGYILARCLLSRLYINKNSV